MLWLKREHLTITLGRSFLHINEVMGKMAVRMLLTSILSFENWREKRAELMNWRVHVLGTRPDHFASSLSSHSENNFSSPKANAAFIDHWLVNQSPDSTLKQIILFLSDFQCQNSTPSLFGFNKFILLLRTLCKMEKTSLDWFELRKLGQGLLIKNKHPPSCFLFTLFSQNLWNPGHPRVIIAPDTRWTPDPCVNNKAKNASS